MYKVKTPSIIPNLAKGYTWHLRGRSSQPTLYLTFDDGPIPEITEWVMNLLKEYNAKGTFFCVGNNILRYPEIHREILLKGHTTGNHTYHHLNGWKTKQYTYLNNVLQSSKLDPTSLFRPPYGKVTQRQASALRKRFSIIMWDVITGDFDQNLTGKECAAKAIKAAEDGSIIVFHDSKKAYPRLKYALPKVLDHFSKLGFQFSSIPLKQLQHTAQ